MKQISFLCLTNLLFLAPILAQPALKRQVDQMADAIESKVIDWRRDLHQNPELSNREFKTAEKVASHLRSLGMEVRTGIAKTGVVGILKGGKPGPVIGLRADMDALPVTERVDLPFKSTVQSEYNGEQVGVMHACGHDMHVAIMMGVAEMVGTIRTLDTAMQRLIHKKIELTVTKIAESAGATAEVRIDNKTPVSYNDPALTAWALPSLQAAAGAANVAENKARTGAEDFGFFAQKIPCFYFFLGGMPKGGDEKKAPSHHTPDFYVDESGMKLGVRSFCYLVLDYFSKEQ